MKTKASIFSIISATLMISGNMIGAGMLGLPLVTGIAGFFPGILSTFIVWFFMYCTGLLFLEITLWMPDGSNVLSLSGKFFGRGGRLFSGGMFLFLYYCLMIAYLTAGAPLFAEAIRISSVGWKTFTLFGIIFIAIVAVGPKSINRVNLVLSISMVITWLLFVGKGVDQIQTPLLTYIKWSSLTFAMPVLFGAFGFHNVIPSLCTYLKRDRHAVHLAIFWGSFLPLIIYLVWQCLLIGTIPQEILAQTLEKGSSVISAFQLVTGNKSFILIGKFFAFFAIVTSMLGVSLSTVDFLGDGFNVTHRTGWKRIGLTLLTYIPPLILAQLNPNIFITILGVAGGFGEAFLNGLLPIGILWKGKYIWKHKTHIKWLENKGVLALLILYTSFVIVLEIYHLLTFK